MMSAVEIYKLLPKTNCGTCGTATCFGFAAKLATNQASLDQCTSMADTARAILNQAAAGKRESPGTVYEQALCSLQPKIRALDFEKTSVRFGARLVDPQTLEISFLNDPYRVTKDRILDATGTEPRPWISILIYNHLCMPDPPKPAGEWVTFSSIPASHAKDKAWAGHVEEEIAKYFSGNVAGLKSACARMGGVPASVPGNHDLACEFRVFPHYPLLLLFYDAVAEENFPAQCKMLLDKTAPNYLDIESIVVLGEEFAGRIARS